MATPIKPITFSVPGNNQLVSLPPQWTPDAPAWLRDLGRTKVLVIDDQIQQLAQLSDEDALRSDICDPLNVEFVFCPECAEGNPLARQGRWIDAVAARIEEMKDSLAAVFLDIMFTGETDHLQGSGIRFLSVIREIIPDLPVLIMTQARDERRLHGRLAEAGLHLDFLQKDTGNRVQALCRFLYEYGWLADPTFSAFSRVMRAEMTGLRRYAIKRPLVDRSQVNSTFGVSTGDDVDMPKPILLMAASGEGKTRMAQLAAHWLMEVEPPVCNRRSTPQLLYCNTFNSLQGAQIALFGRGPQDERERVIERDGLAVRGMAQEATDGIIIIDELGNSDLQFQKLLLTFVESGRTEPEFRNSRMTRAALGPLRVLCIFTAQMLHLEEGHIIEDLARRFTRGEIIEIPALKHRLEEVVPIFYQTFKAYRRRQDSTWHEPADINDLILPAAQTWLREAVKEHNISASRLADLVGEPSESTKVIAIPYLESRLKNKRKAKPRVQPSLPQQSHESQAAPPASLEQLDAIELIERLAEMKNIHFPRDKKKELEGYLGRVQVAASNLLLPYLEACLDIARGAKSELNVVGTYKFVSGEDGVKKTMASTHLKELLLVSKESTLDALRKSDLLASFAIAVADRSKEVKQMLDELVLEPSQTERLRRLGWSN